MKLFEWYDKKVELLAELEHQQWAHWTKYMLEKLQIENPDTRRWLKQINTPYSKLSEEEKKSDRKWARKVMDVLFGPEGK